MLLKAKSHSNAEEKSEKLICVATTHILYNPRRGDCKLAQLQILLANIDRIAYKKSKIINNKISPVYHPILLCGDFNCSNNSKIYEFIRNSKLPKYKDLNRNLISGQQESCNIFTPIGSTLLPERLGISDQCQFKQEIDKRFIEAVLCHQTTSNEKNEPSCNECTFGTDHLSHMFDFNSVYEHYNENGSLEVTSCIQDCKKTVDFIFYHSGDNDDEEQSNENANQEKHLKTLNFKLNDKEQLHLVSRLELFTIDSLDDLSLPDKYYPSDHFLLAAKLILN